VLRGDRCTGVVYGLAPGVLLSTYVGFVDEKLVRQASAHVIAEIERYGRLRTFSNALYQTGIDAGAREQAATAFRVHGDKLRSDILYRSRVMEMGLNIMSMLSGRRDKLRFHSSLSSFVAAIAEVVPGFRALPPLPPQIERELQPPRNQAQ
jgi:hypothetical protein